MTKHWLAIVGTLENEGIIVHYSPPLVLIIQALNYHVSLAYCLKSEINLVLMNDRPAESRL